MPRDLVGCSAWTPWCGCARGMVGGQNRGLRTDQLVRDCETEGRNWHPVHFTSVVLPSHGPLPVSDVPARLMMQGRSALDEEASSIAEVLAVNFLGATYTVKEFVPPMLQRNKGHVVAVSSVMARAYACNLSSYCASKAGCLHAIRDKGLASTPPHMWPKPDATRPTLRALCIFGCWVLVHVIVTSADGLGAHAAHVLPRSCSLP